MEFFKGIFDRFLKYFWKKNCPKKKKQNKTKNIGVQVSLVGWPCVIFTGEISPKSEIKKLNLKKRSNFGGFQLH